MSAKLSVLVPLAITTSAFVSSTVAETDYAAYASGTTYTIGNRVISPATHRIYESLRDGNIGKDPTLVVNQSGTAPWWEDIGATNKWAMFDDQISTPTKADGSLTVVLRPGAFNALYLVGIDATGLSITIKDAPGGNIIHTQTDALEGSQPDDYWDYYFMPFKPQTDFLVEVVDPYAAMELSLTLTSPGTVSCGMLSIGDLRDLGLTQRDAKAKPKSYSYIKTDDFGKTTIKRRRSARDLEASAVIDLAEANSVLATIEAVQDIPAAWIASGTPEFAGLRSFGLGKCELTYGGNNVVLLSTTVQGMI
jgi:hypothetical protein